MAATATLVGRMAWDDSAFKRGIASSQTRVKKFASSIGSASRGMAGTLGIGIGVSAAVAGIGRLVSKYDAIGEAARGAGIGVEEFQRQSFAFSKDGIEMEQYVKMIQKVTRSTEEAITGNKQISASFKALNIDLVAFKALTPDKRVLALADAYKNAGDQQAAFAQMQKIMGRDAGSFRNTFLGGAAAINAAGEALKNVVSEETIAKMSELDDKWTALKENTGTGLVKGAVGGAGFIEKLSKNIALNAGVVFGGQQAGLESIKAGKGFMSGFRDNLDRLAEVSHADEMERLGNPTASGRLATLSAEEYNRERDNAARLRRASEGLTGGFRASSPVMDRAMIPMGFATPSALDRGIGDSRGFATKSALDEAQKQTKLLDRINTNLEKQGSITVKR